MTTLSDLILEGSRPAGVRPVGAPGQRPESRFDVIDQLPPAQENPFADLIAPGVNPYADLIGAENPFAEFVDPQEPNVLEDVVKSGGVGLAKGAIGIGGLPGDVREVGGWVANKLGVDPEKASSVANNV